MLIKRPEPLLCGGCKPDMYGDKCHCLCHKSNLFNGYHEIAWEEPRDIKIVNPESED